MKFEIFTSDSDSNYC